MYSLIRVWIGPKLARMLIQVSVVVRTTSATDSPSTPSLYWMPKNGIQSIASLELEARVAGQEGHEQDERDDPRQRARTPSATRPRAALVGRIATAIGADERQERDDREDREAGEVHRQRPTSTRYEPAMTIRPMAMPSA